MATPKQTRKLYARIRFHWHRLQVAMNDAHAAGVIDYDQKLPGVSPCQSHWETKARFEAATEKALAQALKAEIMNELKGIY